MAPVYEMVVPVLRLSVMIFPSYAPNFIFVLMSQLGEIMFPSGVKGIVSMVVFCSNGMVSPD